MAALRLIFLVVSLFKFSLLTSTASGANSHEKATQNWLNHGGDLYNRRYAHRETKISPKIVSKLSLKWEFYTVKDISATPAIFDGTLYFPSWNGFIYVVKASDGSLVWKKNLHALTGFNATGFVLKVNWTCRTIFLRQQTPTVVTDHDLLIVGIYGPAVVIALQRSTGKLIWSTLLDTHAASLITMSGTYYKGSIYIGTSSLEEILSAEECCTFRGSFAKLDVKSGIILWQTFVLPDNHGKLGQYSGAAIWGSSPSIDVDRKHVYIATGNIYSVPENVSQCQENQNNNNSTLPTHPDACVEPQNHGNSILALDLDGDDIILIFYFIYYLHIISLVHEIKQCVVTSYHLSRLHKIKAITLISKRTQTQVTRKNLGSYIMSNKEVGPGGITGGGTWGAATDKKRVYTNIANSEGKNFTLKASDYITTAVSVANGVLFAGSTNPKGSIYAMNTRTGKILWSNETGATVYGGMSISNGCIYVGNGYNVGIGSLNPMFTGGTSLFAFCVT
ncbi:unnamed protein product [Prunus brigantina]